MNRWVYTTSIMDMEIGAYILSIMSLYRGVKIASIMGMDTEAI